MNLDPSVLAKLSGTRISGQLIDIKPDRGPGARRQTGPRDGGGRGGRDGGYRGNDRGGYQRDDRGGDKPFRKPRHKG